MFSKLLCVSLFIIGAFSKVSDICWRGEITLKHLKKVATFKSFQEWQLEYKKAYDSFEEEGHRFMVWLDNMHTIASENSKNKPYKLRINQFGDLNKEEFRYYVNGKDGSCFKRKALPTINLAKRQTMEDKPRKEKSNPTSVDWREKGVVTPIKNQGQCGSCWAFSATGAMECDYAIKTGELNSLSEQELVDCDNIDGSDGCDGGYMQSGMEYAAKKGGLCSEEEYPYTAETGECKASSKCTTRYDAPSGNGYTPVTEDDESAMEDATVEGCVSIGIEADQTAFQYYSSGVLDGRCGTSIDHGVLIVGYNNEDAGSNYWIVKNSWGESWGVDGYVYICKDCDKKW